MKFADIVKNNNCIIVAVLNEIEKMKSYPVNKVAFILYHLYDIKKSISNFEIYYGYPKTW